MEPRILTLLEAMTDILAAPSRLIMMTHSSLTVLRDQCTSCFGVSPEVNGSPSHFRINYKSLEFDEIYSLVKLILFIIVYIYL